MAGPVEIVGLPLESGGMEEVAEAIRTCAVHLKYLGNGDAGTTMGAIEHHAVMIRESSSEIAFGLNRIAEALESVAVAINRVGDMI